MFGSTDVNAPETMFPVRDPIKSVCDTGVGLPPEKAERIFDAFFTTKPQGSGMGLTISREGVESHGGRIWAAPSNGRGATFLFSLPTATEAADARIAGVDGAPAPPA